MLHPKRLPTTIPSSCRLKTISQRMLHHLFSLTQAMFTLLSSSVLPSNNPTFVNLRIEGPTYTIFEGPVLTSGHNVTTPSGGTHHCDGTNGNANPFPGPTCTSALDDASINLFPFDGYVTYFSHFKFTLQRMAANSRHELETLIVHLMSNLMISSSLPSATSLGHLPNFGVFSSISSSFKSEVANKKLNSMTISYSRLMLLIKHIS